jgi:methionine sulfoxide reductase catalytic subunit
VFETAQDKVMAARNAPFCPWPYLEGVTIEEAANDLAFIVTGSGGKGLPPQNGGAIWLTLPWKYGFGSAKALVAPRPSTFWESPWPIGYRFWAKANRAVPYSRRSERLPRSDERVPRRIFNGYAKLVAGLYTDHETEKLFT